MSDTQVRKLYPWQAHNLYLKLLINCDSSKYVYIYTHWNFSTQGGSRHRGGRWDWARREELMSWAPNLFDHMVALLGRQEVVEHEGARLPAAGGKGGRGED